MLCFQDRTNVPCATSTTYMSKGLLRDRFTTHDDDVKGLFANMKAKNKVKSSTTTLEPFTLFLAFMVMLAKNPFNIIRKSINAHGVPILVKIGQKM